MKRKYYAAVLLTLGLVAILSVGVASADPPPDKPNVEVLSNVACDDGSTFDTIVVSGIAGHISDSTGVGVAKSVYFDPSGVNILVLERGIQGSPPTVWCEWDVPEGHFGGDILLTPPR